MAVAVLAGRGDGPAFAQPASDRAAITAASNTRMSSI
jgi:hypothetical protein